MQVPENIERQLTELGGVNVFGGPNFRLIWGRNRLSWQGGLKKKHDASGNIIGEEACHYLAPKYLPADRWYFEVWLPPETFGSPDEWYRQTVEWLNGVRIETLGPYPAKGEYEAMQVLQTPLQGFCARRGQCLCGNCNAFVPLTPSLAEQLVQAAKLSRNLPLQLKREARHKWEEQQKASQEQQILDKIEDARRPFPGAHVVVP